MWDWLGRRKVLLGKPGVTHLPQIPPNTVGGPADLREGFRIKRRSRTVAHGVAGSTPVHGHGLRLLWYQARVAPFTVNTRLLYPHSSRAPPGFTCFSSFAEGVWAHGQHREVIEGGFLVRPIPSRAASRVGPGNSCPSGSSRSPYSN